MTEKYKRPCILLCKEGEHYKGSGRSVSGVNLFELLCKVSDTLLKFGGHEMAAGLTLEKDKIDAFSSKLAEEAERTITQKMLIPVVEAECELNYDDIDSDLMEALKLLEPYGTSNPLPVPYSRCFCFRYRYCRQRQAFKNTTVKNSFRR